jgi:hypothetical protein
LGNPRGDRIWEKLRSDAFGVRNPDCEILLVLQNIAYVVRCQRVRTVLIRTTFFRG